MVLHCHVSIQHLTVQWRVTPRPCLPAAQACLPHLPVLCVGCSSRYSPTQQCLLGLSSPQRIFLPTIPITCGSVSTFSAIPSPHPKFLSLKPSLPDVLNLLLTTPQPACLAISLAVHSVHECEQHHCQVLECVSQCSLEEQN